MRLNRAMIYVSDVPRMTAFYAGTLGLKPIEETREDGYVEFKTGSSTFALHAIVGVEPCKIASPPKLREMSPVKLSFEVEDVASEVKRLEALGVTIVRRPWGSHEVVDPEGNIFGIYSASD
jgi:catechol 2,3-dioxygenase-like lactoylglutathione lyase family enzyme